MRGALGGCRMRRSGKQGLVVGGVPPRAARPGAPEQLAPRVTETRFLLRATLCLHGGRPLSHVSSRKAPAAGESRGCWRVALHSSVKGPVEGGGRGWGRLILEGLFCFFFATADPSVVEHMSCTRATFTTEQGSAAN